MTRKNRIARTIAVVMMTMAALAGVISTVPAQTPEAAPATTLSTANELAEGVYQWFAFNYNSLVVVSGQDVLVTDPANNMRAEMLRDYIATLTDNPVSHIVLSHEHYDHVGGTSLFPDAKVYCHVNCQPIFDLAVPGFNDVPQVDETFTADTSIAVGDKVVELHYFGPGDGDATTVVHMPAEKIVFTADMYEDKALTGAAWTDDKNYTGTRSILNIISGWDLNHAITAHSASTDPQVLRDNAQYYNDLFDAVYGALTKIQAEGGPFAVFGAIDTLPASIQLEQYRDWANYDSSFTRHAARMMFSIFHGD